MKIWVIRTACWITKTTETQSEWHTYCFTAKIFTGTFFNVTSYVHCFSVLCFKISYLCLMKERKFFSLSKICHI
jgi:hypothetical protein